MNLGSAVLFEFKGKRLLGKIVNIESNKFGKMIMVFCQNCRIGITEKNILKVYDNKEVKQ